MGRVNQAEDGACEALRWASASRVQGTRPCGRKGVAEGKSRVPRGSLQRLLPFPQRGGESLVGSDREG